MNDDGIVLTNMDSTKGLSPFRPLSGFSAHGGQAGGYAQIGRMGSGPSYGGPGEIIREAEVVSPPPNFPFAFQPISAQVLDDGMPGNVLAATGSVSDTESEVSLGFGRTGAPLVKPTPVRLTPTKPLRKPKAKGSPAGIPAPQTPAKPPKGFNAIASGTRLQFRPIVAGKKVPKHGKNVKFEKMKKMREAASASRAPSPAQIQQLRQHSLSVETVYKGAERNTSYTHLIDGDLAPVGRVHLVKMGNVGDQRDNHILAQMDADSNMGAKTLLQRSKRGPFKHSSGRSRVMAKTAHVSYRRRNGTLEITVRRGITEQEMDTLIAKLGAHRLSTRNSYLYIIKGGRKKKIAALAQVKLDTLRMKIYDCLDKYSTIGLLVQDTYEKGALHKGYSHGMEMVDAMRKMPGLFATN